MEAAVKLEIEQKDYDSLVPMPHFLNELAGQELGPLQRGPLRVARQFQDFYYPRDPEQVNIGSKGWV